MPNPTAIGVTFSGYQVYWHLTTCRVGSGFGGVTTYAWPASDHYSWVVNGDHVLPLLQATAPGGGLVYLCETDFRLIGSETINAQRSKPHIPSTINTTYNVWWYAKASLETFDSAFPAVTPHTTALIVRLRGYDQNYGDPLPAGAPLPTWQGFGTSGARRVFSSSAADPLGHLWDCAGGEELGAFPLGHCPNPPEQPQIPGGAPSLGVLVGSGLGEFTAPASIAGAACQPANCDYPGSDRVLQLSWPSVRFRLL